MSLVVERKPIDISILPENLHKHLDPSAPAPLKMMAARGMLPVAPEQNLLMLYALSLSTDALAQSEATKTFDEMPKDIVVPAVAKMDHVGVLDWIADRKKEDPFVLDAVVTNNATHSHTIARVARFAGPNLCDVIATNQVRILEAPVILEQMYQNAHARMATVDRLLELVQREGGELKGLPGVQAVIASGKNVFGKTSDNPETEEFFKQQSAIADEEARKLADMDNLTRAEKEKLLEEAEDDRRSGNLSKKINDMNISERVRLATIGGRDALNLLVRDPNKLVHMAAARSPRLQYPDIRAWARNKTLPDGVIGYIAGQKDYTRHYEVMLGLCQNPKTPLRDTLKFLNHLRTNDLKSLSTDRTISMQVSRQAKQLYQKRSGGGR